MIEYYLSLNSPWSFLGGARLHALAQETGQTVDVRPVDAGQIFPQSGGLPLPKRAPQRQAYRLVDLDRWRKYLGVELILEPQNFPSNEAQAVRLVVAAGLEGHDALALANAFGGCIWIEDRSFADPDVQADVVGKCGLDFASLSERASGTDVDDAMARFNQDAIENQVFGMPTYIFEGELFWGQDRLDFLGRAVRG